MADFNLDPGESPRQDGFKRGPGSGNPFAYPSEQSAGRPRSGSTPSFSGPGRTKPRRGTLRPAGLRLTDAWAPSAPAATLPSAPAARLHSSARLNLAGLDSGLDSGLASGLAPDSTPVAGPQDTIDRHAFAGPLSLSPPRLSATDPRWVLARRCAEALDGAILRPEKRERLVRLGKVMGLSPFDAHLVLAIVQDQARRGIPAASCPAAGVQQLALITPANHRPEHPPFSPARWFCGSKLAGKLAGKFAGKFAGKIGLAIGLLLMAELFVIAWWWAGR